MDLKKLKDYQKHIRNFSIVAHIDHGKSTIADRILELTDTVAQRQLKSQMLDDMPLERQRGITIKLNSVEVKYHAKDGEDYIFHLIDTPGHVDFSYEVSRSLAACEGALLVVDASQGVQAQTLANTYLAIDDDLEILPVINKIDLPSADPDNAKMEIEEMLGLDASDAVEVSGKTGLGIPDLLERIVTDIPAPQGNLEAPLKALIFDSKYDDYRGVVLAVRIEDGMVKPGDEIEIMNTHKKYEVTEVGVSNPHPVKKDVLVAGDVGYLTANIKSVRETRVGDTITSAQNPTEEALPGYRQIPPMVFSGMYPVDNSKYDDLKEALEKLQLNDAALEFEPETSTALGFGFRCGFLGLLHMDVVQERLEQEFNLDLIMTAPSTDYHAIMNDGSTKIIDNPSDLPDAGEYKEVQEPYVKAEIMVPNDFVGPVMELCQRKRGEFQTMDYLDKYRVNVIYHIPLAEIIFDFFDDLKSSTKGYASLDYEIIGYRATDSVKIDVLLNKEPIDALSFIAHRSDAQARARQMTSLLKKLIPRQNFEVDIQGAIGAKIISRATIKPYRKDVTARIHTGDPDRRAKLLDKQKRGKKRMKSVGKVEVPQDAFMAVLKMNDDDIKGK
ncbi:translation elongation factor 4 [Lactobacillus jensenii]|jgi:GTP-binding protein lepA|uniref:Elongation factor 4 n=2 Tax=Lactobacillus jensenii TaxID=109790 RepID=A0A5N1IF48_LACJE|nr:translation elongation factor 4 [Lactobacillus jensenii]EEQ68651.1 GTP-binding protein LepA [Lactobacillus jensenii 1153]ERJ44697.1 GTP-binding protein LepA [Lactobacillus jensenii MD IIE-70(2)]APT14608.1 elongation factor 4 [Lactobacillus jensenii]EEQ24828.1 GTP-binding protein LepA [Lactobacillus jensenii 269-3]EEX27818.1 GTP-binding protein LepA [Lactobacillus jensenii SJ-7A-US]